MGEQKNRIAYNEWMQAKKHAKKTVDGYTWTLETLDTRLDIQEKTQCVFEIDSLTDFEAFDKQLRELPQFLSRNKHHHYQISAALASYKNFLMDQERTRETQNLDGYRNNTWWPSLSEYDPGISTARWLELLRDPSILTPNRRAALQAFYRFPDGVSCKEAGETIGVDFNTLRNRIVHMTKQIHDLIGCPLANNGKEDQYWPIMFVGRYPEPKEEGTWIRKMRPELRDALTQLGFGEDAQTELVLREDPEIPDFPDETDDPGMPGPEEERIKADARTLLPMIQDYITSRGFTYPEGMIENFWLCLRSKPFVILAGTSGTGKTRLVKLFAEAIGAGYHMVPVRPDWSDGSDLFGHTDLNGNFVPGPVCPAFEEAIAHPEKPVFLCLDEMNLARVEYYLSDFLSVIESREKTPDGRVCTAPIAQYAGGIPENLYLVGTVNMDETTFPFSKKVLDRANTIEFSFVDLMPDLMTADAAFSPVLIHNDVLKTQYIVLNTDCTADPEFVTGICEELQRINRILQKANAHVGYRVRDEIVFYLLNNKNAGEPLSRDEAMDLEIMQKILPRIQGSSAAVGTLLKEMYRFCMNADIVPEENGNGLGARMLDHAEQGRYPRSAGKIGYMMTRFEEDGFTSYWL